MLIPVGSMAPPHCSDDGTAVVDDNGQIVKSCGPGSVCQNADCVSPCAQAVMQKSNIGCDFVIPTPAFYPDTTQPCFVAMVANAWTDPVQLEVQWSDKSYAVSSFGRIPDGTPDPTRWPMVPASGLAPNQVAVLFLSGDPTSKNGTSLECPVSKAIATATVNWGSPDSAYRGQAFHITADRPIAVYDMLPFGGAQSFLPSASLVLPTSTWETYNVAVAPPSTRSNWGELVAVEDNTTIKVLPNVTLFGGDGFPMLAPNAQGSITLNRNEFVLWRGDNMSGTAFSSDKPVSFVGGSEYLCMGGGCDSSFQQIPPIRALGSEYVAAPYATRRADLADETIPYRIVAAADGTTLTYDPPISEAPTTLKQGQLVDFSATGSFRLKSQDDMHPFFFAQFMSGCTSPSRPGVTGGGDCLGDEDFVVVSPPAQFGNHYTFFTDSSYGTTNLVITRVRTQAGFKDVTVDCLGVVSGWQPVGGSGQYEVTNVDLVRAGMGIRTCTNGGHVAQSDGPMEIVVWGLDHAASYGYSAGGGVGSINDVTPIF